MHISCPPCRNPIELVDDSCEGAVAGAKRAIRVCRLILIVCLAGLACSSQAFAAPVDAQPGDSPDTPDEAGQRTGMFTTELWLTPLILLPGVALLIGSTSARFGQLHTEFHRLLDHPDAHARILARLLMKRGRLFRDALAALYASVGLFGLGSLLGGVVNIWRPESLWVVGVATIVGIGCVVFAAWQLLRESLICLRVIVDHTETLQNSSEAPRG